MVNSVSPEMRGAPFKHFPREPADLKIFRSQRSQKKNGGSKNELSFHVVMGLMSHRRKTSVDQNWSKVCCVIFEINR